LDSLSFSAGEEFCSDSGRNKEPGKPPPVTTPESIEVCFEKGETECLASFFVVDHWL